MTFAQNAPTFFEPCIRPSFKYFLVINLILKSGAVHTSIWDGIIFLSLGLKHCASLHPSWHKLEALWQLHCIANSVMCYRIIDISVLRTRWRFDWCFAVFLQGIAIHFNSIASQVSIWRMSCIPIIDKSHLITSPLPPLLTSHFPPLLTPPSAIIAVCVKKL